MNGPIQARVRSAGRPNPTNSDAWTDADPTPPPTKRPTYPQPSWPAYNAAQTNEKRLFLPLLADLCGTVPEPPRKPGRGRKPVPLKDGLFATVNKTYSGFSSRRFATDLRDAGAAGHVGKVPHYNFVFKLLDDEAVTPVLRDLVTRSSLPPRAVETRFAVDSSGFSTSKFERWFDAKYGVERRRSTWVKTHLCVGVDTHVVVAAEIGDAHDTKMFPGLVGTAADNFPLCEVVADKAYLSNENLELAEDLGARPYIPFKVNSVPGAPGTVWNRLYHQFALNRDEFLRHYHQRSNVESAFSMVKRKFGDSVRSKTPTAMANVLCKLVAHNVVCCIHEAHVRGIPVGFGPKPEPEPEPRILRFPGA
ncbi:MAG: transposase [Gemmataceae bacterium]|nr:transposase [Gemmataceae bacterium]